MLKALMLSHSFDYSLFKDIELKVDSRESIAILGISGSGKSTLLHILSSFLKPNNGKVFLENRDIYDLKDDDIISLRKKMIGLVFQQHYLFRGFTGLENLKISNILASSELDYKLLEDLKIDHVIKQPISELSGGQQQRVSIARVLIKQPKYLFADEPTGNLDSDTAQDVMRIMREYSINKDGILILATHDEKIARSCDKQYLLENKKLRLC